MKKKILIELKDVWKTYYLGDNVLDVLKNVNVQINRGEFVTIIGPSGSGKSKLISPTASLVSVPKLIFTLLTVKI